MFLVCIGKDVYKAVLKCVRLSIAHITMFRKYILDTLLDMHPHIHDLPKKISYDV